MAEHLLGKRVKGRLVTSRCGDLKCMAPDHVMVVHRKLLQQRTAERTDYGSDPARKARLSVAARKRSRINEEIAEQIRQAEGPYRSIASRFGVLFDTVQKIKSGRYWKDYSNPFAGLIPARSKT